jgi:hypothetical protein
MNEASRITVIAWSVDRCPSCRRPIAVLHGDNGARSTIAITSEDERWLTRGRHPSYAYHLRPMLEALAKRSQRIEFSSEGSGIVSSWIVVQTRSGERPGHIALGLALLMFESLGLPICVDPEIMSPSQAGHHEDIVDAFDRFIATVSPQAFERYDRETR